MTSRIVNHLIIWYLTVHDSGMFDLRVVANLGMLYMHWRFLFSRDSQSSLNRMHCQRSLSMFLAFSRRRRACHPNSSGRFLIPWLPSMHRVVLQSSSASRSPVIPASFDRSKPSIHLSIQSTLLPLNSSNDASRMLRRPELQIPNPLPRPRRQPPILNRHTHTGPHKRTLNMRRHIIRPLAAMPV